MKAMATVMTAGSLLFVATVAAQQQTPPPEGQESEGIPATPHQEEAAREIKSDLFEQLDEDGDGAISRQEARTEASLVSAWSKYDGNGDARLDPDEFSRFEQASGSAAEGEEMAEGGQSGQTEAGMPATRHQEQALRADIIERLDEDGDGAISQEEAQGEARLAARWDQIDRNGDGKLDSRELNRLEQ